MKFKIIFLTLILLFFGAIRLNFGHYDDAFVNVSNISNVKKFNGFIKQRPLTKIFFQTDGKITFMPYSKGDFVKKGQVLARLDGVLYKFRKEKLNLGNEINYNIVIAPYDLYIEEIYASKNSYIKKGMPVMAIYPTDKTEAEILIGAQYINKINLDDSVFVEYKNNNYEAKINDISKSDDNYIINLELKELYPQLKNGANINALVKINK